MRHMPKSTMLNVIRGKKRGAETGLLIPQYPSEFVGLNVSNILKIHDLPVTRKSIPARFLSLQFEDLFYIAQEKKDISAQYCVASLVKASFDSNSTWKELAHQPKAKGKIIYQKATNL